MNKQVTAVGYQPGSQWDLRGNVEFASGWSYLLPQSSCEAGLVSIVHPPLVEGCSWGISYPVLPVGWTVAGACSRMPSAGTWWVRGWAMGRR